MNTDSTFREHIKLIIVRRFFNEARANICAAYLRGEGVQCFISNSTTGTLLPFVNGGFLLHIAERDLDEANDLLAKLDENASTRVEEDYRDADLSDIAYEKAISEHERRIESGGGRNLAIFLIVLTLVFAAFFAYVRSSKSENHVIGMHRIAAINSVSFAI